MRIAGRRFAGIVAGRVGGLDQRVGQHAAESDVNHSPLSFAGHRIDVALAQEADIASGLEIVQRLRIGPEFPVEKLDGPLVLHAAIDQQLFARTLGLKSDARHHHVKRDGNDGA